MDSITEQPQSLNSMQSMYQVKASELFPKKPLQSEDDSLMIPFPIIYGEAVEYLGYTADGALALSNYRLFVHVKETFFNIPLGLIEQVECRDIFFLHIYSKDARTVRCTFATNEHCQEWYRRLLVATAPPKSIEEVFAFAFYAWSSEEGGDEFLPALPVDCTCQLADSALTVLEAEMERMSFDMHGAWRISDSNKEFILSPTYPRYLLVPLCITDAMLEKVARFRSARRIPAVVWRHTGNGAVIARCSQPEVGILGWRSPEDEALVKAIADACACDSGQQVQRGGAVRGMGGPDAGLMANGHAHPIPNGDVPCLRDTTETAEAHSQSKKVLIIDARSYATAVANRARGGGCEYPEYYPCCEIQFMNLANIHSIRKSFQSLRQLCMSASDQSNWFSGLENTKWLHHMSGLLKAAVTVAVAVEYEGRPVLVHCSDGWDRTPQIVALAELLLDPYHRTVEGFQILCEREWLEFGHKFGDRCGQGLGSDDPNERSPIFLQWLDCVHQLIKQFPSSFEFNEAYLIKLAQHTYSNLFGTFLCNSSGIRTDNKVYERTHSVWNFLKPTSGKYTNYLYINRQRVLWPSCNVRDLVLWSSVYLGDSTGHHVLGDEAGLVMERGKGEDTDGVNKQGLTKTRSCENLRGASDYSDEQPQRRSSDPNIMDSILESLTLRADRNQEVNDDAKCLCTTAASYEPVTQPEGTEVLLNGYLEDSTDSCKLDHRAEDSDNEDTEPTSESKSDCASASPMSKTNPRSIDSSTDTLVAEAVTVFSDAGQEGSMAVSDSSETKAVEEALEKKVFGDDENNHVTADCNGNIGCNSKNPLCTELKTTVSTSTSDITDSFVSGAVEKKSSLSLVPNPSSSQNGNGHTHSQQSEPGVSSRCMCASIRKLLERNSVDLGNHESMPPKHGFQHSSSSGKTSRYSTPLHSRTPSSGFPATPNDERMVDKIPEALSSRIASTVTCTLDMDGLTPVKDNVQKRLQQIFSAHQAEVNALRRDLYMTRLALCQQICRRCSHSNQERQEDVISLPESACSGEHQSLGQESLLSDVSWEAIEEGDARPTLWVPDHAVTHCMGCNVEFWLGRRKHHCRNCGKIFCAECSDHLMPIPNEQLYHPVRVCSSCFISLGGTTRVSPNGNSHVCTSGNGNSAVVSSRGHTSNCTGTGSSVVASLCSTGHSKCLPLLLQDCPSRCSAVAAASGLQCAQACGEGKLPKPIVTAAST